MTRSLLAANVLALALIMPAGAQPYGAPPADIAIRLDELVAAYPDHLAGVEGNDLVWKDGTRMEISDGRTDKTFKELLAAPDIDDMFAFPYNAGAAPVPPRVNSDPGRVRHQAFFTRMYGDCAAGDVDRMLGSIAWVGASGSRKVRITTVNGVDRALQAVTRELETLPDEFSRFLTPLGGTFNCRTIAGTNRRSMHAFGAAIDINVKLGAYWRWASPDKSGRYKWRNQIPREIVDIFERHGFIWGGRWYHYDTMHFEYRPELVGRR